MNSFKITFVLFLSLASAAVFSQTSTTYKLDTTQSGQPMLFGSVTSEEFKKGDFKEWFVKNYDDYNTATSSFNKKKLRKKLSSADVTIYMGTWCGDSKKEVPRMLKLLDDLNYPTEKITIHALDQLKQGLNREERNNNIHRVPTIVFSKGGEELGRIVEHPVESLESDMESILVKKEYKPNYYSLEVLHQLITDNGFDYLDANRTKVLEKLKPLVSNVYEMRKYGYIYLRNQEYRKAMDIFELNASLYPDSDIPCQSLGIAYMKSENLKMAREQFEKAIEKNPENKYAVRYLAMLDENNSK